MKLKSYYFVISFMVIALFANCKAEESKSEKALQEALKGKFLIGVAMNADQITGKDTAGVRLIKEHFNSITPENCMKSEVLQPEEGKFDFALADQYVDFGQKNNMFIVGHTLIWHSQAPKWFFVDKNGKDVSREVLIERMKNHITTVVGRYKGRVHGWDVVNEAIEDDGSFRKSKFYQIIGEDFIRLAFEFAHEADPEAELYYNDYSMSKEGKRDAVVKMVRNLQSQGVKIDGIGMQGHMTMDFPTLEEEEKSIVAFSETGVKVMITELDLTVLPSPGTKVSADVALSYEYQKQLNPYPNGLPDSVAQAAHDRYAEFFRLFLKHADKIDRVTMWGLTDEDSWRNNWPVPGRTDYPLLFDRNYQPKPIVETIIKEANQ
ncbi:MAG TPA: endo-1,4-beta-xylanase [Dysgonamonadaceae bacterium]|uniref:1,4-beta-xylanase n=1 Tax=uncultured microorganism TaxID=358574 RepID=A0A7U1BNB2_9ZZZZ|nr:1,4-beta-xylanase [uncultured microorganism]HRU13549.1 endo-1,4-beta-xylanase [Dysgonamonadaceae bacterium]